jgi:phenylacetate-CoA ligase
MVVFRGVNIHPGQIDELLALIPGLGSEFQVMLDRRPDGKDHMTIRVERAEEASTADDAQLAKAVVAATKRRLMVSCEAETVPYGKLPRSERKTRRMFDNRNFE